MKSWTANLSAELGDASEMTGREEQVMNQNRWRKTAHRRWESGQALVFLVLALAIVFLGAGALSVDMSNLWFHRQAAQNAADATCVAGAMDLLVGAQGGATGHQ